MSSNIALFGFNPRDFDESRWQSISTTNLTLGLLANLGFSRRISPHFTLRFGLDVLTKSVKIYLLGVRTRIRCSLFAVLSITQNQNLVLAF
jgi:hypothetical protein